MKTSCLTIAVADGYFVIIVFMFTIVYTNVTNMDCINDQNRYMIIIKKQNEMNHTCLDVTSFSI